MNNFLSFKDVGATVQAKIKGQLSIKQERKLLSRLVVAAKSRPEFNVKDCIGNYEFNVTSPSNFHPDGSMIMSSAKHQVVALVNKNVHLGEEVVVTPQEQEQELVGSETSVLMTDAMCVVNMVTKTPDLTQGAHFAEKFVDIIATMSTGYDEIRVAFDQYLPGSLKERTCAKRTSKTTAVHYHVNDDTKIGNLKMFVSHINTKSVLTKYLSQKLIEHYSGSSQRLLVMYQGIVKVNRPLKEVVSMPEMLEGRYSLTSLCCLMHLM